jgi:hypothetical protein
MQSGPENNAPTPDTTASSAAAPSPLVAALQQEHPEWISEVIVAFGETTFVVPREHIVDACAFLKTWPEGFSLRHLWCRSRSGRRAALRGQLPPLLNHEIPSRSLEGFAE